MRDKASPRCRASLMRRNQRWRSTSTARAEILEKPVEGWFAIGEVPIFAVAIESVTDEALTNGSQQVCKFLRRRRDVRLITCSFSVGRARIIASRRMGGRETCAASLPAA